MSTLLDTLESETTTTRSFGEELQASMSGPTPPLNDGLFVHFREQGFPGDRSRSSDQHNPFYRYIHAISTTFRNNTSKTENLWRRFGFFDLCFS